MFERYTHRAQQVMALAQLEAQRQGAIEIASVHLLAAVLREGSGMGACTLKGLGLELPQLQQAIDQGNPVTPGAGAPPESSESPFTPAARTLMVEQAAYYSRQLGHNYVGTEHILLALLDDQQVQSVLDTTGVTLQGVRQELGHQLQLPDSRPSSATPLHGSLQTLLTGAKETAQRLGHKAVRPEHVLLRVLQEESDGALARFLVAHGVTAEELQQHLRQHN